MFGAGEGGDVYFFLRGGAKESGKHIGIINIISKQLKRNGLSLKVIFCCLHEKHDGF